MTLQDRIAELQDETDYSYADIAKRSGLSRSYVGMIMSGARPLGDPSSELLEALDKAFPGLAEEFTCPCCGRASIERQTKIVRSK